MLIVMYLRNNNIIGILSNVGNTMRFTLMVFSIWFSFSLPNFLCKWSTTAPNNFILVVQWVRSSTNLQCSSSRNYVFLIFVISEA